MTGSMAERKTDAETFIRAFQQLTSYRGERNSRPGSAGGDECVPELAPRKPGAPKCISNGPGNLDG